MRVTWRSLSPIFADITISPWNLLVGGLLISNLSTIQAAFSIIAGYTILGIIFVFYGGLGLRKRKQSSEILSQIFGSKVASYIIPAVLAAGQIGWAAINLDLGGRSLASTLAIPALTGILIFTVLLILMAQLKLYQLGIVKTGIVASALILIGYILWSKLHQAPISDFWAYAPFKEQSLFWGISIVVASLISFSAITPDFFQDANTQKDVIVSTILGLIFPGMLTAFLGCYLFFNQPGVDLVAVLGTLTFSTFPQIFNVIVNTDGAIAMYTPGLKFESLFGISRKWGILVAGVLSCALAFLHISTYLGLWLSFLSIFSPLMIGICLAAVFYKGVMRQEQFYRNVAVTCASSMILVALTFLYFPPVLVGLISPFIIFNLLASSSVS